MQLMHRHLIRKGLIACNLVLNTIHNRLLLQTNSIDVLNAVIHNLQPWTYSSNFVLNTINEWFFNPGPMLYLAVSY